MAELAVTKQATFLWEGKDKKGNRVKGRGLARDEMEIRSDLRKQGIAATRVRKESTLFKSDGKVTAEDIALFARQLATMLNAGIPMVQSFEIIGVGNDKPAVQKLVLAIKSDIETGNSLHQSLAKHPLYFDDLFVNLVEAGEHAGALETVLDKIATYKEKTESIKGKVKKAMFYPTAVIGVAIIVTVVIMLFVIPQFKALFTSFGADLPAFTLLVIAISDFLRDYWWAVGFGLAAFGFFVKNLFQRSATFRRILDIVLLKIPVIGNILNKAALARFARTLSTMFAAGVPLVEALQSVAGATGNVVYSDAVNRMREQVATGQALQLAMRQQDLFPHMVIQMTAIGEESGALDEMLGKVADFYEEEVDNAVDSLSSLLEPLIMVVIGGLVGSLVIAMYLPIFKLAAVV